MLYSRTRKLTTTHASRKHLTDHIFALIEIAELRKLIGRDCCAKHEHRCPALLLARSAHAALLERHGRTYATKLTGALRARQAFPKLVNWLSIPQVPYQFVSCPKSCDAALAASFAREEEMDFFGRKRRAAERAQLEHTLIHLSSRTSLTEAVTFGLLETFSPQQRDEIMATVHGLIVRTGEMPLPDYIDQRLAQAYRDEQSRVMQLFDNLVHRLYQAEAGQISN